MPKIYLYKTRKLIGLTTDTSVVSNKNYPMNQCDFKIYRYSNTNIEFIIRNVDRKPIKLMNTKIFITIVDFKNKKTLLKKELRIVDEIKGTAKLIITQEEILLFPLGYMQYTINMIDATDSIYPLYIDQTSNSTGFIEVLEGSMPDPIESIELLGSKFTAITRGIYPETYYISSAVEGNLLSGGYYPLHSFSVYTTNWTGKLYIEGSLDNSPPQSDYDWSPLNICNNDYIYFNSFSGIDVFNIEINLMWIRFVIKNDDSNIGTFDKILFRN